MRKFALLTSVAAIGFMSDTCETVLVKGSDGPIRVNKSDFDIDQASDKPQYTEYKGKDAGDIETETPQAPTFEELGIPPVAAPSAPNMGGTKGDAAPLPIDPEKNAVAPSVTSQNQRLVMKEGKKFFIVDGNGSKLKSADVGGEIDESGYTSKEAADAAILNLPR